MAIKKSTRKRVSNAANKAKSAARSTGKAMASNPKTTLYVGLGIGALALGYFMITRTKKTVDRIFEGDKNIDNNVVTGADHLAVNTSNVTIDRSQAKIYAQQLLDAMNHKAPLYGTDEATISAVFDRITSDDFKLIYEAFGEKDYNGNNSPPEGFWSNLDSYEKRNLVYWLNAEISAWTDPVLYRKIKAIVEPAGFAFSQ